MVKTRAIGQEEVSNKSNKTQVERPFQCEHNQANCLDGPVQRTLDTHFFLLGILVELGYVPQLESAFAL